MEKESRFKNNFDITKLFLDKNVSVFVDGKEETTVHIPTIKDLYLVDYLNYGISILFSNFSQLSKTIPFWKIEDIYSGIKKILFEASQYKEYKYFSSILEKTINYCFPKLVINKVNHTIMLNNLVLTNEIWDYLLSILRLGCGEKNKESFKPESAQAKSWYERLQEKEAKIKALKAKKDSDKEALLKSFLRITYSFPQFSFDYLFDQTVAQISWLEKYAVQETAYRVNSTALATGNMKKGSKLDFFIK